MKNQTKIIESILERIREEEYLNIKQVRQNGYNYIYMDDKPILCTSGYRLAYNLKRIMEKVSERIF